MTQYRLGIIGLSPGNGHPYSWSAIFNGYDKEKMAECPFEAIPEYLGREDPETMCIEDAKVTHIWTQDEKISQHVAAASLIGNVVDNMTDMIGEVDAVILARDDGENHLEMARPFIDAGVPILIDKPLTDQQEHLGEFVSYYEQGKPIMCCSSFRYSKEILEVKAKDKLGGILTAVGVTPKYWRTYGIHLIEGVYTIMGGGIECVRNVGRAGEEIVHLQYSDGRHAVLQTFANIRGGMCISFHGDADNAVIHEWDAFFQFKNMLVHFVEMLETGEPPFDWHETIEMTKVVIAGQLSLEQGGRIVCLEEMKRHEWKQ